MFFIALSMLIRDRGKYLGVVAGITFASLLVIQQAGIFVGLMRRTFSPITDIALPDIWVMDPAVQYVDDPISLQDTQLYRVRGVDGVDWAMPLYRDVGQARVDGGRFEAVIITGIDSRTLVGGPPEMVVGNVADLRGNDAVIVDEAGATGVLTHNVDGKPVPLKVGDNMEINDRHATVVGICRVSPVFESQPVIYTTYARAVSFVPPERKLLSYILVKSRPGTQSKDVCAAIQRATGLTALTRRQFQDLTWNYFFDNTGIPINFGISVTLGFLVGLAVAGKTFYNFTMENLRHFGTLKAMGADDKVVFRMIVLQCAFAGAIGYGLGLGLAAVLGLWLRQSTLAFVLPWELVLLSACLLYTSPSPRDA